MRTAETGPRLRARRQLSRRFASAARLGAVVGVARLERPAAGPRDVMVTSSMNDPFARFASWYAEAVKAIPEDPDAMVLSSVGPNGRPSARLVLMKGFDARGFVFYTNLESRKGRELQARPAAALTFHFRPLHRQVRIEGFVQPVSSEEADRYFATRARGSQVGAWASAQSEPLPDRETLERRVAEVEARFRGQTVPRPPYWSGYRLVPDRMEFWVGRENRLHERDVFTRDSPEAPWTLQHLYP